MAGNDESSFENAEIFGGDVVAEAMAFMQSGGVPSATESTESNSAPVERPTEAKAPVRTDDDDELHFLDLSALAPKAEEPKAVEPAKAEEPKAEEPKQRLTPTPEQRYEMRLLKMQQENDARMAALQAQHLEQMERLIGRLAPQEQAPEADAEDESLDPFERETKREVGDLKASLAELQHAEMERRHEAAKQGIVSEVSSAITGLQHLEPFRDHIYTAIARDAQRALADAQKTGRAPQYTPIATIVTQVDQAVRMASAKLNGTAPAAKPAAATQSAATQAKPAATAPAAKPNVHPATPTGKSASASQVLDVRKHSFEDLAYLTTRQYQAAQGR